MGRRGRRIATIVGLGLAGVLAVLLVRHAWQSDRAPTGDAAAGQSAASAGASASNVPAHRTAATSLLIITIDTLRADRVGAYGAEGIATPALDRLARDGARFERAFAPAPITLPSHASLLTGRYPPGHGSRHNGMAIDQAVPTLATLLKAHGFATAAFVAAFPLDRRFGLARGFDVYSDRIPRGADGRPANERPGSVVVGEALAWLAHHRAGRFLLWVHLFEPHAPYGDARQAPHLTARQRYDREIETADAEIGRLLVGLGPAAATTLVVAAGDHGEAFGEHDEVAHSLFVYDTTLRVPLVMSGPGVPSAGRAVPDPVTLVDVLPTVLAILGLPPADADGIDLSPALAGAPLSARDLYAESFAPLLDFGWSPLRAVRSGRWKAIEAPRHELFDVERDPGELDDRAASERTVVAAMAARLGRFGPSDLPADTSPPGATDAESAARLGALGYVSGRARSSADGIRPDPKDRRELAARIAAVAAGEVRDADLRATLESILAADPGNGQAHLRLGDLLISAGSPGLAEPHFAAAVEAGVPGADPFLGLAACQAARGAREQALDALRRADAVEPGNPVVSANLGLLEEQRGRVEAAVAALRTALEIEPDFHQARFNLALVYARAGRRAEAHQTASDLLRRLPAAAPQRGEVERLLAALR